MAPPRVHFDWTRVAHQLLEERGFLPEIGPAAQAEVQALHPELPPPSLPTEDLRGLLWSSIDNSDSRDLDQLEWAEPLPRGEIRVRVAVADVDSRVKKGSAIDDRAAHNTTSVYTGLEVFPMLPERLSTELTSCNPDEDRYTIVSEFVVRTDGDLEDFRAYPAVVRSRAKLSYEEAAAFLEGDAAAAARVAEIPGLAEQLHLQDTASRRLKAMRHHRGALEIESSEARAVTRNGEVVGVEVTRKLRTRELIEDFMIAANRVMAGELDRHDRPSIGRVVDKPRRWDRIVKLARDVGDTLPDEPDSQALAAFMHRRREASPETFSELSLTVVKSMGPGVYMLRRPGDPWPGHFGLAVQDYTHSTAPNRRFSDLVTQRLLKAAVARSGTPYSEEELAQIAARCTEKENHARAVERQMRKVAMALLLKERIGETFAAIVTGVASKGTFVRLLSPPAEGRVVVGEQGMDIGDEVQVKLVATSPEKGFIDFVRA